MSAAHVFYLASGKYKSCYRCKHRIQGQQYRPDPYSKYYICDRKECRQQPTEDEEEEEEGEEKEEEEQIEDEGSHGHGHSINMHMHFPLICCCMC